jgi:hypothetical protein
MEGQVMKKKLIVVLSFMSVLYTEVGAAASKEVTATVKKIGDFSESGDGYTFTTKAGKEYYVYSAGGASPRQGEQYLQESEKKGINVCLKLSPKDGMGDIASVSKGACKGKQSKVMVDSATTKYIVLLKKPDWSEEGLYLKTDKGVFAMQTVNIRKEIYKAFANAKKGQCLALETEKDFDFSSASDIKSVKPCN